MVLIQFPTPPPAPRLNERDYWRPCRWCYTEGDGWKCPVPVSARWVINAHSRFLASRYPLSVRCAFAPMASLLKVTVSALDGKDCIRAGKVADITASVSAPQAHPPVFRVVSVVKASAATP